LIWNVLTSYHFYSKRHVVIKALGPLFVEACSCHTVYDINHIVVNMFEKFALRHNNAL